MSEVKLGHSCLSGILAFTVCTSVGELASATDMASEDIAKLAEALAQTQVAGGQLSFKGKSLKLNTAEDGECVSRLEGEGLGGLHCGQREARHHLLLLCFGLL